MNRFTLILLAMMLTACQSTGSTQAVEFGCSGAAIALKALTAANRAGKLSASDQAMISNAAGKVSPVCMSATPPTLDALKREAFVQAVAALEAKAAELKGR